jgi:hypothetical protein
MEKDQRSTISEVRFLSPREEIAILNDNVDVLVSFNDGREYLFVVGTPTNVYELMLKGGTKFYVGDPFLLVDAITEDNIRAAVEALVEENDGKWLNTYGTLQQKSE